MAVAKVTSGYMKMNGVYLESSFISSNYLKRGDKYPIVIDGLPSPEEVTGRLYSNGVLGGLAPLYDNFTLGDGDEVPVKYEASTIILAPPTSKLIPVSSPQSDGDKKSVPEYKTKYVFERQSLRHLHIERFTPGRYRDWVPRGEPDVYMVFGEVADLTKYQYCCGTATELLDRLGYSTNGAKPDAILIERSTGQYLIAEFEVQSSKFKVHKHERDAVDVLVCWEDDEVDRDLIPGAVLALQPLIASAIKEGLIEQL